MKVTSQMRSVTFLIPTFRPAKTLLGLILRRTKQVRPWAVTGDRLDMLDMDTEPQPPDREPEELNKALGEANGTPLSDLVACGGPYSSKARSNTVMAVLSRVDCSASTASRSLLAKSLMVRGSNNAGRPTWTRH